MDAQTLFSGELMVQRVAAKVQRAMGSPTTEPYSEFFHVICSAAFTSVLQLSNADDITHEVLRDAITRAIEDEEDPSMNGNCVRDLGRFVDGRASLANILSDLTAHGSRAEKEQFVEAIAVYIEPEYYRWHSTNLVSTSVLESMLEFQADPPEIAARKRAREQRLYERLRRHYEQ